MSRTPKIKTEPKERSQTAKTKIPASLLVLLSVLCASAQTVAFPDSNLEVAVRQALGMPSGDITEDDMLALTSLYASRGGITNSSGLEFAVNLTELDFSLNPVTDYSGIAGLFNLQRLVFNIAGISDVSFLSGLENLREIEIYQNAIQDISPLSGLTNLTYLQLDLNPVTSHWPLTNLVNLERVSLAGNGVTNLNFVVAMPALKHLGLYVNQVKDISPLAGRTHLLSLGLGWNGVTNPAVLATLTGLRELMLNGNPLTSVAYLAGLTNLTGLALDYTALADMSPVTNLWRLQWLNVGENGLTNLPNLSALTNLSTFAMAGNQIADLSPVTNLVALTELHVQRSVFTTIAPLTQCQRLERLLLSGNPQLGDLSEISTLTQLRAIEARDMGLTNLAIFVPLTNLWQLDLQGNRVTDLSALTKLPNLWWLSLQQNGLTEIGPLLNCPALGYVNLKENFLDTSPGSAAWGVIATLLGRGVTVEYDAQHPLLTVSRPANRSAFVGDSVAFHVNASNGIPAIAGYRWQKNGVDLADDARISGSGTDTLWITGVTADDAGMYRVRVWDDRVTIYSAEAELRIITNVAFADPNLEETVRAQLGIYGRPLTPGDLVGMSSLYAGYAYLEITNLGGLEAAVDLEDLDLNGQFALQGLTPLSFLPNLTTLRLSDCGLDNLSFVAELPALTFLEVSRNFIEDLAPLRQRPGQATWRAVHVRVVSNAAIANGCWSSARSVRRDAERGRRDARAPMPKMPMMPMEMMERPELNATGQKTNLLGYACEKFEIKQAGEVMEIWATDKLLPFRPWLANQPPRFGQRMIEEQWGALLRAKKLFPLLAVLKFENGPERLRFEVKAIKAEKVVDAEDELFRPPKDYREIEPLQF